MIKSLVLASSSPYRRTLLERLRLPFTAVASDFDETPKTEETPSELVKRLSIGKARTVAETHPGLIIGSDQVSINQGKILGKPHTHENAIAQLQASSGNKVTFLTGVCLYDSEQGLIGYEAVPFHVHFRQLSPVEIDTYLKIEQPYDCAGSFRMEGLGITLFDRLEGDDPNALIGLPLIALLRLLRQAGIDPLIP